MTLILAASALTCKEDIPPLLSLWSDLGEVNAMSNLSLSAF
jgi:hypothetical protein